MKKVFIFILFSFMRLGLFSQTFLMKEAEDFYNAEKYSESLEILNKVLDNNPKDMEALMNRSCVLSAINENAEALRDIEIVVKNEPFNLKAIYFRGNIYECLGEHLKAIEDESYVLEKLPNFAPAYNIRGYAYKNLNYNEEAIRDFTSAIVNGLKKNEDVDTYYQNRAYTYYCMGKYDESMSDANTVISLDKNNVEPIILISKIYRQKSEIDEAIKWVTKAIKMRPDFYEIYYLRIIEYLQCNQYENAKSDLDYIKNRMSGFSAYHSLCAAYYSKIENNDKALEEYKKSRELRLNEKDSFVIQIIESELDFLQAKDLEVIDLK